MSAVIGVTPSPLRNVVMPARPDVITFYTYPDTTPYGKTYVQIQNFNNNALSPACTLPVSSKKEQQMGLCAAWDRSEKYQTSTRPVIIEPSKTVDVQ